MNTYRMAAILKDNYSPGELEERLDLTMDDIEDGLNVFIDDNYDEVLEFLREDLWFD